MGAGPRAGASVFAGAARSSALRLAAALLALSTPLRLRRGPGGLHRLAVAAASPRSATLTQPSLPSCTSPAFLPAKIIAPALLAIL